MWKLKGCPKCGGDLIVYPDGDVCLQCGFRPNNSVTNDRVKSARYGGKVEGYRLIRLPDYGNNFRKVF